MWAILFIAAGFFVAILAMGYFAVQQGEGERAAGGAALASAAAPTACAVCDAPPRARPATSDEIVFEVEHRIDTELRDISHALHAHPERFARIFDA